MGYLSFLIGIVVLVNRWLLIHHSHSVRNIHCNIFQYNNTFQYMSFEYYILICFIRILHLITILLQYYILICFITIVHVNTILSQYYISIHFIKISYFIIYFITILHFSLFAAFVSAKPEGRKTVMGEQLVSINLCLIVLKNTCSNSVVQILIDLRGHVLFLQIISCGKNLCFVSVCVSVFVFGSNFVSIFAPVLKFRLVFVFYLNLYLYMFICTCI